MPVLDSLGIVILQRDEAEGLNIQSAVIRPTSNFIANSPRLLGMRPDVHWHSRKGSREKEVKYEVRMLYYVQSAKRTPRGGSIKLPFSELQYSSIQTLQELPANLRLFGVMYYLAMDSRAQ